MVDLTTLGRIRVTAEIHQLLESHEQVHEGMLALLERRDTLSEQTRREYVLTLNMNIGDLTELQRERFLKTTTVDERREASCVW